MEVMGMIDRDADGSNGFVTPLRAQSVKSILLRTLPAVLLIFGVSSAAAAQSMDKWLRALDPNERGRQACILRGLTDAGRDAKLQRADRMKSSIFGEATIDGDHHVVAKGGAVRIQGHWYSLAFDCHLSADHMRANDFRFSLGAGIPKEKWADLGLW